MNDLSYYLTQAGMILIAVSVGIIIGMGVYSPTEIEIVKGCVISGGLIIFSSIVIFICEEI